MGATFPNGIASFATHKNLLDDVEASHINKIQDEVVAIEATLGDALTTLQVIEQEITALSDQEMADQAKDASLVVKYTSLKELVNSLWNGKNFYVASASKANFNITKTPWHRPYPPNLIKLNKPSAADDPSGMWNGTGFTLKKSGFYLIQGFVDVNTAHLASNDTRNFGTYEGSITFNGTDWIQGLDRQYPVVDGTWHDVVLNPTFLGWLTKGTRVTLRAAQSSAVDQTVLRARLSLFMLRSR